MLESSLWDQFPELKAAMLDAEAMGGEKGEGTMGNGNGGEDGRS